MFANSSHRETLILVETDPRKVTNNTVKVNAKETKPSPKPQKICPEDQISRRNVISISNRVA